MLKTDSPKEAILLSKNMPVAYKNYILLNGIVIVAFVEKQHKNNVENLLIGKETNIENNTNKA